MFAVLRAMRPALNVHPMEFGMQFKESAVMLLIMIAKTVKVKINGIQLFKFAALTFMIQHHHLVNVQMEITILS